MTDKDLRTLLEGLQNELQRAESVDDKDRALLRDLDADIRALLQRSGDDIVSADESLLQGFQVAMDHFEVTHPSLTTALSELMNALNNAGI